MVSYISKIRLGVAQLVARYLGVVEAASSSLVTQTKKSRRLSSMAFFAWRDLKMNSKSASVNAARLGETVQWTVSFVVGQVLSLRPKRDARKCISFCIYRRSFTVCTNFLNLRALPLPSPSGCRFGDERVGESPLL